MDGYMGMSWDPEEAQQWMESFNGMTPFLMGQNGMGNMLMESQSHLKRQREYQPSGAKGHQRQQPPDMRRILTTMGQLLLRQEMDLAFLKTQDTFLIHLNSDPKGLIPLLLQASSMWKENNAKDPFSSGALPLRTHLAKVVFQELLNRFLKDSGAKPDEALTVKLIKERVLLQDQSWPVQQWDGAQLIPHPNLPSVKMATMNKCLEAIVEHLTNPHSVIRFSSLPAAKDSPTVTWRLQVPLNNQDLIHLLRGVASNSVWQLVAAQLRMHRPQPSTLAMNLAKSLNLPMAKGKGKGKKGQSDASPHPAKMQKN